MAQRQTDPIDEDAKQRSATYVTEALESVNLDVCFDYCVEAYSLNVEMSWTTLPTGDVCDVEAVDLAAHDPVLEACFRTLLMALKFPPGQPVRRQGQTEGRVYE